MSFTEVIFIIATFWSIGALAALFVIALVLLAANSRRWGL